MARMAFGDSMAASSRRRPPQRGQAKASEDALEQFGPPVAVARYTGRCGAAGVDSGGHTGGSREGREARFVRSA